MALCIPSSGPKVPSTPFTEGMGAGTEGMGAGAEGAGAGGGGAGRRGWGASSAGLGGLVGQLAAAALHRRPQGLGQRLERGQRGDQGGLLIGGQAVHAFGDNRASLIWRR